MSKLTLDALKERAEVVTSKDLLNSISGGTENSCHPCDSGDKHWWNEMWDEVDSWLE